MAHNVSSPWYLEKLLPKLKPALNSLQRIHDGLQRELAVVFFPHTVGFIQSYRLWTHGSFGLFTMPMLNSLLAINHGIAMFQLFVTQASILDLTMGSRSHESYLECLLNSEHPSQLKCLLQGNNKGGP